MDTIYMEPNPTLNYMGTITIVSIFQATGKHYNLLKYAGYVGNVEGSMNGRLKPHYLVLLVLSCG